MKLFETGKLAGNRLSDSGRDLQARPQLRQNQSFAQMSPVHIQVLRFAVVLVWEKQSWFGRCVEKACSAALWVVRQSLPSKHGTQRRSARGVSKCNVFFFVDDEPRRWTNLAICAEREEHDAPPVFFVWSFSSAVENQVSARALRLRFRRSCQCPCAAA